MYLLNIDGDLKYYSMQRGQSVTIATGFEQDPTKPKLTEEFNSGRSQNLAPLNFYDVIKKKAHR